MGHIKSLGIAILWLASQTLFAQDIKLQSLGLGAIEPQLRIDNASGPLPDMSSLPFRPGEAIHYDAYHKTAVSKVLAGHCAIYTRDVKPVAGQWAMGFKLEAISADWYSWVFVIRDSVEGYFDLLTNKTLFLDLKKKENTYTMDNQVEFDYQNKRVISKAKNKGHKPSYDQYQISEEMVDPYSIVFLIRRRDLSREKDIKYTIYSNGDIYHLHARVQGEEVVTVGEKKYKTYKVKVLTKVTGAMEQRGGLYVYFTADAQRIPVLVEGDVKIGEFSLEMTRFKP